MQKILLCLFQSELPTNQLQLAENTFVFVSGENKASDNSIAVAVGVVVGVCILALCIAVVVIVIAVLIYRYKTSR